MSENEMVERVARAICCWLPDYIGPFTCDDGRRVEAGKPAWTAWKEDARAAIAAMREPTEEMWKAGSMERGYVSPEAWSAMIDAALKPAP